jgi:ABC-type glycerol-3-phosphate transport system substrate-binding protein
MDKGKILTYFIFVLAGAIAFSFYTSLMVSPVSAAEKHTLVFWHAKSGHRGKVWAKMVDEFNKGLYCNLAKNHHRHCSGSNT